MKTLDYDIAVIGGGAAGLTAAYGCASEGMKTVVIDREGCSCNVFTMGSGCIISMRN